MSKEHANERRMKTPLARDSVRIGVLVDAVRYKGTRGRSCSGIILLYCVVIVFPLPLFSPFLTCLCSLFFLLFFYLPPSSPSYFSLASLSSRILLPPSLFHLACLTHASVSTHFLTYFTSSLSFCRHLPFPLLLLAPSQMSFLSLPLFLPLLSLIFTPLLSIPLFFPPMTSFLFYECYFHINNLPLIRLIMIVLLHYGYPHYFPSCIILLLTYFPLFPYVFLLLLAPSFSLGSIYILSHQHYLFLFCCCV